MAKKNFSQGYQLSGHRLKIVTVLSNSSSKSEKSYIAGLGDLLVEGICGGNDMVIGCGGLAVVFCSAACASTSAAAIFDMITATSSSDRPSIPGGILKVKNNIIKKLQKKESLE